MPSAPKFEAPQGQPLHEVEFRGITESLAGNGVLANGDLEVTDGTNALEIDVAAGTVFYIATEHTFGGASPAATLTGGDATYDRWDTIAFDTGTSSVVVHEGTPEQYPTAPDIGGKELLLATIYVPAGATDIDNSSIRNWRAKFSNEAEEVHYDDNTGVYGVSSVDAALDELQEAAQIGAHPLAIGDLDSPYAPADIASVNGYPFANSDLSNSVVTVAGKQVGLGGSTAVDHADLSNVLAGQHHTPHEHPGDQQAISDIQDDQGNTVYSYSDAWVPREQVDDERLTAGIVTSNTTTSGEEVLLVDTSGGAVTITLASADIATGNFLTVVDVGGSAGSNAITIDTEGGEGIDGGISTTVDTNYGATVIVADTGTNQWYTAGGGSGGGASLVVQDDSSAVEDPVDTLDAQEGLQATNPNTGEAELAYEHREVFEGREAGNVSDTNQGILVIDHLADGETAEVYKAALTLADGQAAPSSLDLKLVTLDNAGSFTARTTLISGDGSTVFDDETGSPLGSYTNSSGGGQTIGMLVDNATGSAQDVIAVSEGVTGQ